MSKQSWIKQGPHKGTRSPYGGPAKTVRGSVTCRGRNEIMNEEYAVRVISEWDWHPCWLGRPPRGMQEE